MKIYLLTDTHYGHRKLEEWGRHAGFEGIISNNCSIIEGVDLTIDK